jgi:hypothetical protein
VFAVVALQPGFQRREDLGQTLDLGRVAFGGVAQRELDVV